MSSIRRRSARPSQEGRRYCPWLTDDPGDFQEVNVDLLGVGPDVVDRDHVGVRDPGHRLGLADHSGPRPRVVAADLRRDDVVPYVTGHHDGAIHDVHQDVGDVRHRTLHEFDLDDEYLKRLEEVMKMREELRAEVYKLREELRLADAEL